tara:strand:+ start:4350 stop:4916 length:567 start_codon:yes stop_codon:yes gene_type:complete
MEPIVKKGLLNTLALIIKAVKKDDNNALRTIGEKAIQQASLYQDKDSISIAVIAYALSKLSHRCDIHCDDAWMKSKRAVIQNLHKLQNVLRNDLFQKYKPQIKLLLKQIGQMDKKLGLYIEEVIEKSKIKKGSAMHAQGISLGRTSELLGISQWELLDYMGKTTLTEFVDEEIPVKQRIEFAREIFGL